MRHYGRAKATSKGGLDLVTEADIASEKLIVDLLRQAFPAHAVVAEESAPAEVDSEWVWYVDPLDGTSNFSRGDDHFAVFLGLVRGEKPYLGIVFNPVRDGLFTAAPGRPEDSTPAQCQPMYNGCSIHPFQETLPFADRQAAKSLDRATIATDWPWTPVLRHRTLRLLDSSATEVRQVKIRGCAALDLCDVARGVLDAYIHPACMPWDLAGALAIHAEIGTSVWSNGRPWKLDGAPIVASSPSIAEQIMPLAKIMTDDPLDKMLKKRDEEHSLSPPAPDKVATYRNNNIRSRSAIYWP